MEREEAIKVIKNNWPDSSFTMLREALETLIPELKEESEDERIRKELLQIAKDSEDSFYMVMTPNKRERLIAWLEKQGNHQKFRDSIQVGDSVTRNEDGVLVNLSLLNRVAKRVEPTYTQKDVDDAYLKGLEDAKSTESNEDPCKDCDQRAMNCQNFPCDRKKAFEQKPAAWSEEDEELYREALVAFASLYNEVDPVVDWGKLYSWFKSLKGKIQPKQEWSEEDSVRLQRIIDFLWHNRKGDTDTIYQQEQDIDWLKSLRPQNRCAYNPYKAVVDSIAEMCKHYDKANHSGLRDFYDNVKVKCKDAKEYDSLYPQNTWKPSDEQMEYLHKYAEQNNYTGAVLTLLYNDLKKLI